MYVGIKNFFSDYSEQRDEQFRELYPQVMLALILKDEYLVLEKEYVPRIKRLEYRNSPADKA